MTRLLKEIPRKVLCPDNPNIRQEARVATVYGVAVVPECLNPDCNQKGPLDALILGPLDLWPNIVVVCGPEGCGMHWALVGSPPQETTWIHIEEEE